MRSWQFVPYFFLAPFLFSIVCSFDVSVSAGAGLLETVIMSDDVAPGTGGRQFDSFDAPDLNDLGQVSFSASLQCCTPRGTVFSTGTGQLELVAWEDSPAVTGSTSTFNSFREVQIDNLGRTMIRSEMSNLPSNFDAVWIGKNNEALTQIAVSGQIVNPNDPTTTFYGVGFPHLSGGGFLAGRGVSQPGSSNSDILFRSDGTMLAESFTGFTNWDNPVVNDNGQIVARLGLDFYTASPNESPERVLRSGEPLPPTPGIPNGLNFGATGLPVINNAGAIGFAAISGPIDGRNRVVLWRLPEDEDAEFLVRDGMDVPNEPGAIFDDLFFNDDSEMPIWINDRGDMAFWASLVGAPNRPFPSESAWIGSPGDLRPVLIEGDIAPGTGGVFASESSTHGDLIAEMAVNNLSQVAVFARYEAVPGQIRHGLFATDVSGDLQKIAAIGDMLETSPGIFREVENISFEGDQQAKRGTGFNDLGQVAFSARFTDGTQGVFISSIVAVPEPSSFVLLMVAAMLGGGRRFVQRNKGAKYRFWTLCPINGT